MFYSLNQPNIHKQFNVPQSTNGPLHNNDICEYLIAKEIKIDLCGSPCTFHITLNAQVFGSHTKATNHWQSDKSCHSKAITQQEYNYRSNQLTNSVCRLALKLCNLKKYDCIRLYSFDELASHFSDISCQLSSHKFLLLFHTKYMLDVTAFAFHTRFNILTP